MLKNQIHSVLHVQSLVTIFQSNMNLLDAMIFTAFHKICALSTCNTKYL